jgi:alpha-tubulin suppressor-like RCC1 family protein
MDWWSGGMKIRTLGFAIVSESPTMVADRRNAIGTALIERLDTLAGAHAREPGRRADLMRLLGEALVRADADLSGWPNDLPQGLSEPQGDSAALAWLVYTGQSLESVRQTWWPRIAPQAALTLLADWKSSGRITAAQYDAVTRPVDPTAKDTIRPTIRIVSPAQGTSVSNDTGFIVVEAIVTDASGIARVEIEGTRLYQSPWRARVDLAVGQNPIRIVAIDSAGNKDTLSITVVRQALGDRTKPVIKRLTPQEDTLVPWTTRSIVARWNVQDDSLLSRVSLGTSALTGADGNFERTITLDTGTNSFILSAFDHRGNPAFDTLVVRRARDAEPPKLTPAFPTQDTTIAATQDSLVVAWEASDNDSLLDVTIGNVVRSADKGRFEATVPLVGDSMWIVAIARDRTDNTARDSIKVVRLAAPVIAPSSRGLKAPQIVTVSAQRGTTIEISTDAGKTWTPYTQELEVASNTRLMARAGRNGAFSELARADYAFAPGIRKGPSRFLGTDTLRFDARGSDSVESSLDGTTWSRTDSFRLLSASVTLRLRARVGSATSPIAEASVQVHSAKVIAGFFATFLLMDDHSVWAAGRSVHPWDPNNAYGTFGDGHIRDVAELRKIQTGMSKVSPGFYHTLYQSRDGSTWAAGWNANGQFGNGTMTPSNLLVRTMDGEPYASGIHSHFLDKEGVLWGSGYNATGQLGDGTSADRSTPVRIMDGVRSVVGDGHHTLILRTDNTLWGVGSNAKGQLGLGSEIDTILAPRKILEGVKDATTGPEFSVVLKLDGTVLTMGSNDSGQLGPGGARLRPTLLEGLPTIQAVAAGAYHALFLSNQGSLLGTGSSAAGQLGKEGATSSTPILVAQDVIQISAGEVTTLFGKSDGSIWGLGANEFGGLATGTAGIRCTSPVRLRFPSEE